MRVDVAVEDLLLVGDLDALDRGSLLRACLDLELRRSRGALDIADLHVVDIFDLVGRIRLQSLDVMTVRAVAGHRVLIQLLDPLLVLRALHPCAHVQVLYAIVGPVAFDENRGAFDLDLRVCQVKLVRRGDQGDAVRSAAHIQLVLDARRQGLDVAARPIVCREGQRASVRAQRDVADIIDVIAGGQLYEFRAGVRRINRRGHVQLLSGGYGHGGQVRIFGAGPRDAGGGDIGLHAEGVIQPQGLRVAVAVPIEGKAQPVGALGQQERMVDQGTAVVVDGLFFTIGKVGVIDGVVAQRGVDDAGALALGDGDHRVLLEH